MKRTILYALLTTITALLVSGPQTTVAQTATATQTACPAPLRAVAQDGVAVICSTVTVPAQHADPTGPTVDVLVAVAPATGANAAADPLVIMQGGPGGSAIATLGQFLFLTPSGAQLRASRDVILLEARGTRYADPFLFCEEDYNARLQALETVSDIADQPFELEHDNLLACKARLEGQGLDFDWFDHAEIAADVPYALQALGYEQPFNFYGLSYASLTAQHLLRDHEDSVRSVIMDGVVPADVAIGTQSAHNAERAFNAMFAACAQDVTCNTRYPNLEQTFFETFLALNANPALVTVRGPDGTPYQTLMTGQGLVTGLFNLMYDARTNAPAIPQIIAEASRGDYSSITRIAEQGYFDRTFADGLQSAVLCAEDGSPDLTTVTGTAAPYFLTFTKPLEYVELCSALGVELLDQRFNEPVISNKPALLFSGLLDPVTPPAGGDAVAATLPNARHIQFAAGGHTQLFYTECSTSITLQFLNNPQAIPNTACASEAPDFYTNAPRRESFNNMEVNIPGSWINRSYLDRSLYEDGPRALQVGVAEVPLPSLSPGFLTSILGDIGTTETVAVSGRDWFITDYTGTDGLGAFYAYTVVDGLTYAVIVRGPQAEMDTLYSTALLLTLEDFTILGPPLNLLTLQ